MPDLTDYLRASNGSGEAVRCIVVDPRGIGDLVFNNTTPTNWHSYFIAMAGTVDPATDRFIEGEYIVFKGHLDGSAITIDELAPGYVDNGNQEDDIIVIKPTTLWADIVADTMDTVTQAIIDAEAATVAANAAASAATTATGLANTATTNANNAATAATNAANATSWTQGTAVPTGGYDGNFYLRTTTYDVYQKIAGVWTIVANIKGATGATGSAGANGSTWYQGSGAPSSGTGANGDFYWRTDTSQVYQKQSGSWVLISTVGTSNADTVDTFHASSTPTANTILPLNASGKFPMSVVSNNYLFRAKRTGSSQSIGDSTATTIVFNTEDFDPNNNFNTSTGQYTVPVTGYYQVNASVDISGPSGGTGASNSLWGAASVLRVNATQIIFRWGVVGYDQMRFQRATATINEVIKFTAGDVIDVQGFGDPNGGGAAVAVYNDLGTTFSMVLVGV